MYVKVTEKDYEVYVHLLHEERTGWQLVASTSRQAPWIDCLCSETCPDPILTLPKAKQVLKRAAPRLASKAVFLLMEKQLAEHVNTAGYAGSLP